MRLTLHEADRAFGVCWRRETRFGACLLTKGLSTQSARRLVLTVTIPGRRIMLPTVVKLNAHNQIRLPKAACEALGIEPGERIMVIVDGREVRLLPEPKVWSDYIYGLGKPMWEALGGGEKFLREERAAWANRRNACPRRASHP